jgi:hypothetical protein
MSLCDESWGQGVTVTAALDTPYDDDDNDDDNNNIF